MAADGTETFGNKDEFALEVCLLCDDQPGSAPLDSVGSWGEWRLWVAGLNLCSFDYHEAEIAGSTAAVRWYLAPLFRWFVRNWNPLLHEGRLPSGGRWGDSRPRWARLAYLTMVEGTGDDMSRFGPWQDWASRHALRSAAQGGIVPDVFFHRIGDDIELSWGDRVQPGAETVFVDIEDGMSRVPVDAVAAAIQGATDWFCHAFRASDALWARDLVLEWQEMRSRGTVSTALSWFLDGQEEPGRLTRLFHAGLRTLNRPVTPPETQWWGTLAPEVGMFGALAPQISEEAATLLLSTFFEAATDEAEAATLTRLRYDDPAWMVKSPWANGYSLAEDVLDEIDPDPSDEHTDIERILTALDITVKDARLGAVGPRGVAFAGCGIAPTILVNVDHPSNRKFGRRFTLGHELCHILFDRNHAGVLAHSSTPWAPPAVEQRANAFAAMLLMPRHRARRPIAGNIRELSHGIRSLAIRMKVSDMALRRHLANIGEISPDEGSALLGEGGVGT